jgi:hypothetical protein
MPRVLPRDGIRTAVGENAQALANAFRSVERVRALCRLMQTSTPALQRDFENAVFQAIVK